MCSSPRTRYWYSPPASSASRRTGLSPNASRCMREASSATSNSPMPWMLLAVPVKYLATKRAVEADGLEDLRPAVRLIGRDAHLRHHLVQALADRLHEALGGFLRRNFGDDLVKLGQRLEREVRMDRFRAVAGEQREVMHFARRAGLDDEARAGAQAVANEVLMHRRRRQQAPGMGMSSADTVRSEMIRMLKPRWIASSACAQRLASAASMPAAPQVAG